MGNFVEGFFRLDHSHTTSRFLRHGSRGAVVGISSREPTPRSVIILRIRRISRFAGIELHGRNQPMHIVASAVFTLAAIVGLAPTLAFLIFWDRFPSWLDDLSRQQTLFVALIFAASLASIAAALTILNRTIVATRQRAAQRWEQDLKVGVKKQQIASAHIGVIDVILNELHNEFLIRAIENALRIMEARTGIIEVEKVRIGKYAQSFDKRQINVSLFPSTISKGLTRFYTVVEETNSDLDWYSRVIEMYTDQQVRIVKHEQLIGLLKKIRGKIDLSSKLGERLVEDLKNIRHTESKRPTSDEWWSRQTVDFNFKSTSLLQD